MSAWHHCRHSRSPDPRYQAPRARYVLKMLHYQLSSGGTAVQCMKLTANTRLL